MPLRYTEFDGLALPQYDGDSDLSTPKVRTQYIDLQYGAFDVNGTGPAPIPNAPIKYTAEIWPDESITDFLLARADLKNKCDAIRAKWNVTGKLYGEEIDELGGKRWRNARLVSVGMRRRGKNSLKQLVDLSFETTDPYWYSEAETVVDVVDIYDEGDDLATVHAEGLTPGLPAIFPITVLGNKNVVGPVFTFTPTVGPVTSVTITNSTTGYTIVWAGDPLAVGKSLVIDCGALAVTADGVDDYRTDHFTEPANKELWMELVPGVNTMALIIVGGDGLTRLQYYPAYA